MCSRSDFVFVPGMQMHCHFEAPAIGSFHSRLVVQGVAASAVDGSPAGTRISAEFAGDDRRARDVISSCLIRPMSSNSVRDLQRENLLVPNWIDLVEFSALGTAGRPNASNAFDGLKLIGRLSDEVVCELECASPERSASIWSASPHLDSEPLLERARAELARYRRALAAPIPATTGSDFSLPARKHPRRSSARFAQSFAKTRFRQRHSAGEVRWDEYAQAYDVMCASNPAYQSNIDLFREWISTIALPANAKICDVGAGTGNYALELARRFPDARVIHLDSDPMMNRAASRKYRGAGAVNVEFKTSSAGDAAFTADNFDLIVCINALYTFPDTKSVLERFRSWLKPTSLLFLIDLGRPMDVADWSRYIVASSLKAHGISATVKSFIKGRKAIGQNRLIRREQDHGRYWLHSPQEFRSVISAAGFDVLDLQTCYRGVCDLAVARKVH